MTGLDQMQSGVGSSFEDQANEANTAIDENAEKVRGNITQAKTDALKKIDETQSSTERALIAQARGAERQIEAAGEEGKKRLDEAREQVLANIEDQRAQVLAEVGGMDLPDPGTLKTHLESLLGRIEGSKQAALGQLAKAGDELNKGIQEFASKEAERLAKGAAKAAEEALKSASKVSEGIGKVVTDFSGGLDRLIEDVGKGMDAVKKQAASKADEAIQQFNGGLDQKGQEIKGELDKVNGDLQAKIDQALSEEPSKISEAAEKEAEKIQPWWKKAISIVASIVVAVVVLVFSVALMLKGAPILLAIVAGGALAGAVGLFTKDTAMWLMGGGQSPFTAAYWTNYLAAAIMGGLSGGLGAVTAPLGPVLTGIISGLSLAGLDQALDIVLKGESFNLAEFVLTALTASLISGVVKAALPRLDKAWIKSVSPGPRSWDTFQHQLVRLGIRGLSSTKRAAIYKLVKGVPSKATKDLIQAIRGEVMQDPDGRKQSQRSGP